MISNIDVGDMVEIVAGPVNFIGTVGRITGIDRRVQPPIGPLYNVDGTNHRAWFSGVALIPFLPGRSRSTWNNFIQTTGFQPDFLR